MLRIRQKPGQGFTLMELMVVVVIMGVIAAFAIPNYSKSVQKAHERDMQAQLTSIHAASQLYRSYAGGYWDSGGVADLAAINSNLSISIIANGATYTYSGNTTIFIATAIWQGCTMRVSEAPISTTNPYDVNGGCLSL